MTQDINDDNFAKEVLMHKGLVLIDFWADWCGPCKMLGPIIEELSVELKHKIKILKMNIQAKNWRASVELIYNITYRIPAIK